MPRRLPALGAQELAIMKVVWRLDRATVRDVYEALRTQRTVAYTTVMTMMKILEEKGYLSKTLRDRSFLYQPVKPRHEVIKGMVRQFVDRVFNGAAEPLLVHLAEDRKRFNQLVDRLKLQKMNEKLLSDGKQAATAINGYLASPGAV